MSELNELRGWLESRLPELLAEHKVPAASIAVYAHGEMIDRAAGVLNKHTGVEATADSVFQIGSITKVWTTTLAMQLVDEGALDIDAPVRAYLPEFAVGDETASAKITVRQLMCHTSGFEGDVFLDTGRGDDAVHRLVTLLADVPQLFTPGEMFSYNNAAFCVLGRIVEVLRDKSYDDCLRDHLCTPLGLTHVAPSPYEAVRFRAASGHLTPDPDAEPQPAQVWALPRSNAPAGSMLAMRPRDLLTFARMHLDGGRGPDGTAVLTWRARRHAAPRGGTAGSRSDGRRLGTGLVALRLARRHGGRPRRRHARPVGLPTGGSRTRHRGGVADQRRQPAPAVRRTRRTRAARAGRNRDAGAPGAGRRRPRVETARFVGTYASSVGDTVVSEDADGRLWAERTPKGVFAELDGGPPERIELVAYDGDRLIPVKRQRGMHMVHAFVGDDGTGRARFLHTGRADRRVSR